MAINSRFVILLVAMLFLLLPTGCSSDNTAKRTHRNVTTRPGLAEKDTPLAESHFERASVTRVIDGDTIEVALTNRQVRRVRYIGIDTPERYEDLYREKQPRQMQGLSRAKRYGWLRM
ncbi:MAG TPA: hypothetical protein VE439_02530 [Anaerolineae bacterium]|nr:hypothetical protein [Anaerolineae bacterium]